MFRPPTLIELRHITDWIIRSPNLLVLPATWNFPNNFSDGIVQEHLDDQLTEIESALHLQKTRLGRLFESLVIAIFKAHSDYTVLEHGVGIFRENRQITELDLIMEDADRRIFHLEISVKFYLYAPFNGEYRIAGSDGSDVIDERLMKFDRQLTEGSRYLNEAYPNRIHVQGLLSKGRLFEEAGHPCLDPLIDYAAERGRWTFQAVEEGAMAFPSRWGWICWPPLEDTNLLIETENRGEVHAWLPDGPEHVIYRRREN